jgi:hypothetical protein
MSPKEWEAICSLGEALHREEIALIRVWEPTRSHEGMLKYLEGVASARQHFYSEIDRLGAPDWFRMLAGEAEGLADHRVDCHKTIHRVGPPSAEMEDFLSEAL